MDRRNFLRAMVGGVATAAAVRTFPFRVFSFPKEVIKLSDPQIILANSTSLEAGMEIDITGLLYNPDLYDATGPYMGIRRDAGPHIRNGKYTIKSVDTSKHIVTLA